MKQIVAFLLFSFFPKLFPGESVCGKNYLHWTSNIYDINGDIEVYMSNILTESPQENLKDIFRNNNIVRNSSAVQMIKSGVENSEFNIPSNTICATVILRNYTDSYFGWRLEQINTCGPSDRTKCTDIIEKETNSGIVIEDCFNYMCTKDGCTARFIVKKSYANNQYILWSLLFLMSIIVAALKKNGKFDIYYDY